MTTYALYKYLLYEFDYGKINQKTKQAEGLAVRSVRGRRSILHSVFDQAIRDSLIDKNPADPITITNLKNSNFEEEALFLSKTEIDDLLAFLHEKHPKILPIAFVGISYGLRRSEILGLKWSAINFENHTITIDNTIVKMNTKNFSAAPIMIMIMF